MLFDLDMAPRRLRGEVDDGRPSLVARTGGYHNLLRRWAEA